MQRIRAIKRDAQTQGKVSFEEGSIVADEMGAIFVEDAGFDSLKEAGSLEQLETERSVGIVVGRKQGEPVQGVTGNDSGKEIEVIFDHTGVDRLGSDIDHPSARLREQQKQKEKTFFVALGLRTCCRLIDRH